jgi:L,D-peptidoglycan transpeptidase YkuD (ErfK/YbiS/YcfS/YnhG family)
VETARHIDGEHLADSPRSYEFAVSSGYNALPNRRVFGRGTAIFLHINHRGLTAGCVSVSRRAMIRLCRLLDPARRPACAIGTTRGGTAISIYAY